MIKNRRGISPIIATVLIIVMGIAAVAILAGFLVPFVKNSLQKGTECLPYENYYAFDDSFGYNCVNASDNSYLISIKASFDKGLAENVEGMKIVFTKKNGESQVIEIKNNSVSSSDAGGIYLIGALQSNLRLPGPGGVISYGYNAPFEEFSGAEVYPVLKGGRICADRKESINIKPC